MLRKLLAGAIAAMLLAPLQLGAQYDPQTIALLPRYCIYTQVYRDRVPEGNNKAEIDRWYSVMGGAFHHMHHYCWGLDRTNAATFSGQTPQSRRSLLTSAIAEFDYVIEQVGPNFVLLPEIFTKKGENLIRVGRGPLAVPILMRAIELKPDYWPASAALSDYYTEIGNSKMAREVLEKALSYSPNARALQERWARLNGAKNKSKTAPESPRKSATSGSPPKRTAPESERTDIPPSSTER